MKKLMPVFCTAVVLGMIYNAMELAPPKAENKEEIVKPVTVSKVVTREDKIANIFNPFTGAHPELVWITKRAMADPDSFKHIKTSHMDTGKYIYVKMTYSGSNRIGMQVVNTVEAHSDTQGYIIRMAKGL